MAKRFKRFAHHDATAPAYRPINNAAQDQLNLHAAEPVASVQRAGEDDVLGTAPSEMGMGPSEQSEAAPQNY